MGEARRKYAAIAAAYAAEVEPWDDDNPDYVRELHAKRQAKAIENAHAEALVMNAEWDAEEASDRWEEEAERNS